MSIKARKFFVPLIGSCCIAVFVTGCSLLPQEEAELTPPLVEPVAIPMKIYEASRKDIVRQITGVATFESDKMDYLHFTQSDGRLIQFDVKLGDEVKVGDVIATVETGDLESKISLKENAIKKIQISMQQLMAQNGEDHPSVEEKRIDLDSAMIELEQLRTQLRNSKLISNINGIVSFVAPYKAGDKVEAYKEMVTISDPTSMKLVYTNSSSNSNLSAANLNMNVEIKYENQNYTGKVVQTPISAVQTGDSAVDTKNKNSIFIKLDELPPNVQIGSQAEISIIIEKKENTVVIPKGGLRTYLNRKFVQVLEGDNSRREIDVEVGVEAATEVEIVKGLEEGQKVILVN